MAAGTLGSLGMVAMTMVGLVRLVRARRGKGATPADAGEDRRAAERAEMERRMASYLAAREDGRRP